MRSWKSCSCVGVTVTAPPTVFVGSVFSVSASHAAVLCTTQQTVVTSHSYSASHAAVLYTTQ